MLCYVLQNYANPRRVVLKDKKPNKLFNTVINILHTLDSCLDCIDKSKGCWMLNLKWPSFLFNNKDISEASSNTWARTCSQTASLAYLSVPSWFTTLQIRWHGILRDLVLGQIVTGKRDIVVFWSNVWFYEILPVRLCRDKICTV